MLTVGIFYFSNLGRKCIISEKRFVLELPTSRAMLATARLLFWNVSVTVKIRLPKTPIFRLKLVAMAMSLERSQNKC